MRLLSLDISSTHIGMALFDDGDIILASSYAPPGDLRRRLVAIGAWFQIEVHKCRPDFLAIEAPAFASREHVAIQRAVGAVLCNWTGSEVLEIAPTSAKLALTGSGKADKADMIKYAGYLAPELGPDEHASDAIGVGLAALGKLKLVAIGAHSPRDGA